MPRLFDQNLDIIAGDVVRTVPVQMVRTTDFKSQVNLMDKAGRRVMTEFSSKRESQP